MPLWTPWPVKKALGLPWASPFNDLAIEHGQVSSRDGDDSGDEAWPFSKGPQGKVMVCLVSLQDLGIKFELIVFTSPNTTTPNKTAPALQPLPCVCIWPMMSED